MSIYDRRRTVVAALITLIALPALFWAKKDHPLATPAVASADAGGALAAAAGADAVTPDAAADQPPGYLSGPPDTESRVPNEPSGPPADETFSRAGLATYRTFDATGGTTTTHRKSGTEAGPPLRLCNVNFLPAGTRITVENTDNGKRVECYVERGRMPTGMILVVDATIFAELSDLAEAPIPVRIRW